MNGNPTAEQKRLHNWIIESSCCMVSDKEMPELHHIEGSKALLKGVKGFGEWYVIGLSFWWHRDGNNKHARHPNKYLFLKRVGDTEKEMWIRLMDTYFDQFGEYPMSVQKYQRMVDRA